MKLHKDIKVIETRFRFMTADVQTIGSEHGGFFLEIFTSPVHHER